MSLLTLDGYDLHYGEQIIFSGLNLRLNAGDRLCIIGRNGVGKSTLLKCIEGKNDPDSGARWLADGHRIATLSQDLPDSIQSTVYDFVASGVKELGDALRDYEALSCSASPDLDRLEALQQIIESMDGWAFKNRIEQVLTRLQLDGDELLGNLSGGWRRRVSLAQALVSQPDVLLLDEPTNHLDIAAIQWLEKQLLQFSGALVFITHDRSFLKAVANKIGELDRGVLTTWDGDYNGFLEHKNQMLENEARQNALFDKKLAQEEVWIRQGIKARRTRNEGRVRALKSMRDARAQRREQMGTASIDVGLSLPSGKLVAELKGVSRQFDNNVVIRNFSSMIIRGDKIGLIGPNGIGKSTLLRLILGEDTPDGGSVKLGTKLQVSYFDQTRDQLNLEKSAIDNVSGGRDTIEIDGRQKHIIGYLQDFLFSGERARTPIKSLSGGERNRVLLAKLFSKPSNLLVMDEPTNDLDTETLELLETLLVDYAGTLLLVSHDRTFLDNVVSSTIAFEGDGRLKEYVGGYEDWVRQGGVWPESTGTEPSSRGEDETPAVVETVQTDPANSPSEPAAPKKKPTQKLSYKLQRELDQLPEQLEKLETELETLNTKMAADGFYSQDTQTINDTMSLLAEKETALQAAFDRWETLEQLKEGVE